MTRLLSISLAVLLSACATRPEETNCDLSRPPKDSGYDMVQGTYAFIYPQAIGPNYSGCQTMWGQDGKKRQVLRVVDGKPTRLLVDGNDQCAYDDKALVQGDPKTCPSLYSFRARNGLGSMPITSLTKIPPEADIRER